MKKPIAGKSAPLWAGIGLCVLASCSVHVDALSEAHLNEAAATELAQMFVTGESVAYPLSLDDVIGRAVLNNLDNRLLRLEQSFALAQVDVDSMEMLPTLAASAGYTNRTRENFTTSHVFGTTAPSGSFSRSREAENMTNSLSTTWNVLDFTLGYFSARQAGNSAFIAEERARRAGMGIIRDARQSFWNAYAAQQLSGTIATTIAEANAVLARIEEGERGGAIPAVEALRSRRTVLENVRQLEIFSHELATARIELAQLVNVQPGSVVALAPSRMSVPSLPGTLPELEARAFTSNPSLREQQYRINIALDDVRWTTAQLFPDLSLSAEANFDADAFLLNNRWNQFGLTAGWNLMRLMTAPQRIDLSERGVEVERARALAVRMAVLAQTHIAYRDFHFARAQFQRASALAEIDRQLAQQSRVREEASVGSQVERIVVETSSLISQLRVYEAYGEVMAAYSAVLSSIGADADLRQILEQDQQDRAQAVESLQ
jgi:outer membrane protein TolC